MKNLTVKTDGNLLGSNVYDNDGNSIGTISEVSFIEPKPLTIVKIGSEDYRPTPMDLENWKKIFEEAEKNGSKIFTHSGVTIEKFYTNGPVKIEAKTKS